MSGTFRFELKGVKELTKLLDQLPTVAMQKTVLRNALKKAGKPIADEAKRRAPVKTGKLRDSIIVSKKLNPRQRRAFRQERTQVYMYVGSTDAKAHLVEFGTTKRYLKTPRMVKIKGTFRRVSTTGFMSPNPFMRNAWRSKKHEALKIFAREMKNQLYKSAGRLAKRASKGTLSKTQIRGLSK